MSDQPQFEQIVAAVKAWADETPGVTLKVWLSTISVKRGESVAWLSLHDDGRWGFEGRLPDTFPFLDLVREAMESEPEEPEHWTRFVLGKKGEQ